MKRLGRAWIVLEESFRSNERRLIAIISPRKTASFVADYIEQAYVDRFASFNEKIAFKKDKRISPFRLEHYMISGTTIRHGHEPMFNAYYAHKLEQKDENLRFRYRVYKSDSGSHEFSECVMEIRIA